MQIIVEDRFGRPLQGAQIIFKAGNEVLADAVSNVGRASLDPPEGVETVDVTARFGDVEETVKLARDRESHVFRLDVGKAPVADLPAWFPIAGFVAMVATMIFLGVVVVFSGLITDEPLSRAAFSALLGLGVGAATMFFGGSAAANGKVPLPGNLSPLQFSINSGAAVFLIVSLVTFWQLGSQDEKPTDPAPSEEAQIMISTPSSTGAESFSGHFI